MSAQFTCTECDTHLHANAVCGAIAYTYPYANCNFNSATYSHTQRQSNTEDSPIATSAPKPLAARVGGSTAPENASPARTDDSMNRRRRECQAAKLW